MSIVTAVAVSAALAALLGLGLAYAAARLPQQPDSPVERVNSLLPQSQCGQCGYPGCRPYASAIISGEAPIDRCAPGGDHTVTALARLLGRQAGTVDPAFGIPAEPRVAVIDESHCIGCALCLDACPVDAIVGAAQFSHTILAAECTGCELCVAPCPVDCIAVMPRRVQAA